MKKNFEVQNFFCCCFSLLNNFFIIIRLKAISSKNEKGITLLHLFEIAIFK